MQRPGARMTKFSYDGDKRVTSTQNPGANSGTRNEGFVYDTTSGGKPRTVKTEADGRTVTSEYDAAGRLRFLKDRKGATFEFRYDALGRRTHVITPTGQTTKTDYKKNGRAASVTEPSGDSATFNYNATTGRLSSVVYAGTGGAMVNYTGYDANGNLLSLNEGGNGTITRTYDGLNRVTSYTESGKTIEYRYYASGKLAKVIYPGGTETGVGHVEYTYDADGRLYQVIDKLNSTSSPRTTSYFWYSDGRLQSISRPNGTTRTITYDAVGRPEGITESAGLVWTIGYYASDDIRTLDMTPAIPANQLSAVPNASMTFDAANCLATFNGQTITHDLDGNMVSGPLPTTGAMGNYTYDSRNRLTGAGGFAYRYNAEGNRVGLTSANETTTLTVDPQGALPKVLERVKNGVRTRYVYGAGLQYEVNDAGAATYYHYDQSGNTAALTNQAGAIIERVVYSPYGTIRYRQSNHDTPFLYGGFFGVMTDANGLIAMRARYYNPLTMRFLNSDPAMDGLNWYAYANGNPISNSDPSGLAANISIGYTQVPGFGIHGQHHTFTIIQDTETGEQMVTRAGPSAADGVHKPSGVGFGYLKADALPYLLHPRDNPSVTVHIQPVGVVQGDFSAVVSAAQNFRDITNGNKITYSPVGGGVAGLNSNSYTGTFIQSLGFSRPTPDLPSPGFQNGRASPSISYTPFSTGVTAPSVYSTQPKKSNK